MNEEAEWRWQFFGFESAQEGRPVQLWFDHLPDAVKDEIRDLLGYLEKMTDRLWRRPEFASLKGDGEISELRPKDVPVEINREIKVATYRIYGFFGPRDRKRAYTFLHGTPKIERNDATGKRIAKKRLKQLGRGEATVHEFEF
jgi:hypothetical protein